MGRQGKEARMKSPLEFPEKGVTADAPLLLKADEVAKLAASFPLVPSIWRRSRMRAYVSLNRTARSA